MVLDSDDKIFYKREFGTLNPTLKQIVSKLRSVVKKNSSKKFASILNGVHFDASDKYYKDKFKWLKQAEKYIKISGTAREKKLIKKKYGPNIDGRIWGDYIFDPKIKNNGDISFTLKFVWSEAPDYEWEGDNIPRSKMPGAILKTDKDYLIYILNEIYWHAHKSKAMKMKW